MKEKQVTESNNKESNIILVLAVLSFILFIIISIYRWPFADDFGFIKGLESKGVLEYGWHIYNIQDARFITPTMLAYLTIVKYFGFSAVMVIGSLNYLLSAFFAILIMDFECKWRLTKREMILMTAVFNFAIWILSYDYLENTLYWMSTTSYNLSIAVGLFWYYIYRKNNKGNFGFIFYIFTFIAASTAQMVSLPLLTLVIFDVLFDRDIMKTARMKLTYLSIFIFFVILASTVSPGAFHQFNNHMHLDGYYAGSGTGKNYMYIKHFIDFNIDAFKGRISLFIIFSIILIWFLNIQRNTLMDKFTVNLSVLRKFKNYKYILASFASLVIYWPTLLSGGRYYESFTYLFLIALVIFLCGMMFFNDMKSKFVFNGILPTFLFLVMIIIYGRVAYQSRIVRNFMVEREGVVKSSNSKVVSLDAVDFSTMSRPVRSVEISSDAAFYVNQNYAAFYTKDSVKAVSFLTYEQLKKRIK